MKISAWARDIVATLLPAGCVACGVRIPPEGGDALVCPRCRARLREAPWPRCPRCHVPRGTGRSAASPCRECASWPAALVAARHVVLLQDPADALVHGLKYEGWAALAGWMGAAMARLAIPGTGDAPRVVVPVPTTPRRLRLRGYNQARLLAEVFARDRDLPLVDAVERRDGGATQVALHPSQRLDNVRGAFTVRPAAREAIRGAHVILVDDVLTTGSTASAVTDTLVRGEAVGITLVTYARALPFRHS